MPKVRKAELSFLYATRRLVLFYISTKYHKSKGSLTYRADTKSMDYHSNITKGDNAKSKKAELSFVYVTRCLVLFYISA